jgi:FkbM family methyltransferase
VGFREAFLNRVVSRIDQPTQAKLEWRARQRSGSLHARVMTDLVALGDTAIDIGANWGLYTIGLSTLVGPTGHVVAVEPGPALVALQAVCQRSANVEIYPLALSDQAGTGRLEIPDGSGPSASALARVVETTTDAKTATEVRLARLDELDIPNRGGLRFVKCDVEGHEDAVLRGGEELLREHLPSLLIEIEDRHRDRPVSDAFDLLSSWGYEAFALTASGLRPLEQFDVNRDQLAHLLDGKLPIPAPTGYINDFLFVQRGVRLPWSVG